MVNFTIDNLIKQGKLSRIVELQRERYVTFYRATYRDNHEHAWANTRTHPRWSIISGYYAMHDITKLLLVERFGLRVEYEVHATTIRALKLLVQDPELLGLMEAGYDEFSSLAGDLARAKRERVRAQYYTGTAFSRERFARRSSDFLETVVGPYIERVERLMGEAE